mmetsp:Transcript_105940/g.274120  ORF Transcript_105940/g.274120 Transcript_105940/m.274120 type:complete len:152 (-) Transcript_105940:725-1180(-)
MGEACVPLPCEGRGDLELACGEEQLAVGEHTPAKRRHEEADGVDLGSCSAQATGKEGGEHERCIGDSPSAAGTPLAETTASETMSFRSLRYIRKWLQLEAEYTMQQPPGHCKVPLFSCSMARFTELRALRSNITTPFCSQNFSMSIEDCNL